jgi:undecaprenyl-diphosphatase
MYWASNRFVWFPCYAWLLYILLKQYNKGIPITILFTALLITISDKMASGIIKPLAQRLRPCHNALIENMVHINGGCGGTYGFVSSHAANSFAIALFTILLLGKKYSWIKWVVLPWAMLVSYSRIYNGVHYPGDVICGGIVGIITGLVVAGVLKRYYHKKYLS